MNQHLKIALLGSLFAFSTSAVAEDGYVLTNIRPSDDRTDRAFGVALLPADGNGDHQIVSAGQVNNGNSSGHALTRHGVEGALQWIRTTFFDSENAVGNSDHAYDALRQADGKIVTAGFSCASARRGSTCNFALTRWSEAGVLDSSFGSGGKVQTAMASPSNAIALKVFLSGTKLVAVGKQSSGTKAIVMARYTANGALDKTFGNKGKVLVEYDLIPESAAMQADGKILIVGRSRDQLRFAVARFLANGAIDSSFGSAGRIYENIGYRPLAKAVVVHDSGRISVVGQVGEFNADVFVKRYLASGAADASFGVSGLVVHELGAQELPTAALGIGDELVLAAASYSGGVPRVAVAKLLANGSLNPAFGIGGIALPLIGDKAMPYAIKLQANGKLMLVGESVQAPRAQSDFMAARLLEDGSLDLAF